MNHTGFALLCHNKLLDISRFWLGAGLKITVIPAHVWSLFIFSPPQVWNFYPGCWWRTHRQCRSNWFRLSCVHSVRHAATAANEKPHVAQIFARFYHLEMRWGCISFPGVWKQTTKTSHSVRLDLEEIQEMIVSKTENDPERLTLCSLMLVTVVTAKA